MAFLVIWGLFSQLVLAADRESGAEIVVQAPRLLDESIEASRSVTIITEQEIRSKNPATVADLLRDLPGVEVVRQGPIGQTVSVFIRGARSEDTLVLIDGVIGNDSMSPSRGFDFSSLSPHNIERIEVYRGPQSVRFGAGALGGVINIITKEGRGTPKGMYFFEGGTYDTAKAALAFQGGSGAIGYSVSADGTQTRGFPAAAAQEGNTIPNGATIGTTSGKLTWQPDKLSKIDAVAHYSQAQVDLDRHGGARGDDPNDTSKATQFLSTLEGRSRFFDERLSSTLGVYYSEVNRSGINLPDSISSDFTTDTFLSENQRIASVHEFNLTDNHLVRLNLEWNRETGASASSFNGLATNVSRQEQSILGEAITYLYESPTWFGDVGARLDEQSKIGNIPSWRGSLGRTLPAIDTRLSLTYGTGFKVPSLYQLYSIYGDQSLQIESSSTFEATIEQKLPLLLTASLGYFQNSYRNMIDYDLTTNKYLNISSANCSGIETQLSFQLSPEWSLVGNYTYLNSVDGNTGLPLVRRPTNSANLTARYHRLLAEAFSQIQIKGQRPDVDPITFVNVTDPPYILFNLGASYIFSPLAKVSARIENLFNHQYEEAAGYGSPGFSYYVGVSGEL